MKKHLWAILYSVALLAFTVYVASDTFLISRSYNANATEMNTELFESSKGASNSTSSERSTTASKTESSSAASSTRTESSAQSSTTVSEAPPEEPSSPYFLDETRYEDENISISLSRQRVHDTEVYIADVKLSSAQYLKTAFAFDTYGKNVTAVTSEIAAAHNAIFAVNGDYYGIRESGFVIRNGVVYRDTPNEQVLAVFADGDMEVVDPYSVSADELAERGVWQAFSFGPALVDNGEITVDVNSEVARSKTSNPRTAVGMIEPLHYIFVVSDGRTDESKGLSLFQLAGFMRDLGADTAYNLDGGGSSSMVFNGRIINKPTSNGNRIAERSISDIVYIG